MSEGLATAEHELAACRYCGSTATAMQDPKTKRWWIECDNCGISTPHDGFGDPYKVWNSMWNANQREIEQLRAALKLVITRHQIGLDIAWRTAGNTGPRPKTERDDTDTIRVCRAALTPKGR